MGRKIKPFNETQLLKIKDLYETTIITISELADLYNVGWNYMSKIIHNNNIQKPQSLHKELLSRRNKKNWQKKTTEQRRKIAIARWEKISEEEKVIRYKKISNSSKLTWANKSSTEKERLRKINSEIHIENWKNKTSTEKQAYSEKQKSLWTKERIEKHRITMQNINAKRSESSKEALRKLISLKSKQTWEKMSDEQKYNRNQKLSQSMKVMWKNRSEKQKEEVQNKIYITKVKNQTFGNSKVEIKLNLMFQSLNMKDYIWQYRSGKYYYDFKIGNTLIELNGKYWHYEYPFEETVDNIKKFNDLYNSGIKQYKAIAKKWRYTDVKKLKYAKQNGFSFIRIYYDKNKDVNIIYKLIIENLSNGIKTFIL